MGREIDHENHEGEDDEDVNGGGSPLAMGERIREGVIHVEAGVGEARSDEAGKGNRGLQDPAAAVVASVPDGPEQEQRHPDVE